MRTRFWSVLLAALLVGGPILALNGCASGSAIVSQTPTPEQQMAVRVAADKVVLGFKTAGAIITATGRFVDTLPIANADKNEIDGLIVAAIGTTAKPGPVIAALDALASVTTEASLKATVATTLTVIDPLLKKLETHPNLGVAGFGVSLRAATEFARAVVNQGGVK